MEHRLLIRPLSPKFFTVRLDHAAIELQAKFGRSASNRSRIRRGFLNLENGPPVPDPAAFLQIFSRARYTMPPSTYLRNFDDVCQTVPELEGGFQNLENRAPVSIPPFSLEFLRFSHIVLLLFWILSFEYLSSSVPEI